jgi:CspA family cold shock protein
MPNGLVKFFNAAKGFGFITSDEGGKDVFVPASSVTASGLAGLKPGQRVSFGVQPDARGPKAIDLKMIADAPPPAPVMRHAPAVHASAPAKLTIYLDPNCDKAQVALADLRAAGESPHIVDYITAPPSRDELKSLSMLLRDAGQNLVRKYDPLFQELRLDDRFISDADFWGGIFENPSLINGPVLAGGGRAAICRSENAVEAFLAVFPGRAVQQPAPAKVPEATPTAQAAALTDEPVSASVKPAKVPATATATAARPSAAEPKAGVKPNPKTSKAPVPTRTKDTKVKAETKAPVKKIAKKTVAKVAKKTVKPKSR